MTEDQLWDEVIYRADHFGAGIGYRSDLFLLLATILAYYKSRGTEPSDMLSDTMMRTIDNILTAPTTTREEIAAKPNAQTSVSPIPSAPASPSHHDTE